MAQKSAPKKAEPIKVTTAMKRADADKNGWFIEAMFLEPVMGEGDPMSAMP